MHGSWEGKEAGISSIGDRLASHGKKGGAISRVSWEDSADEVGLWG